MIISYFLDASTIRLSQPNPHISSFLTLALLDIVNDLSWQIFLASIIVEEVGKGEREDGQPEDRRRTDLQASADCQHYFEYQHFWNNNWLQTGAC